MAINISWGSLLGRDFEQEEREQQAETISGLLGEAPQEAVIAPMGDRMNVMLQGAQEGSGFRGGAQGVPEQMQLMADLQTLGGLSAQQAQEVTDPMAGQSESILAMLKQQQEGQAKQREHSVKQGNVLRKERGGALAPFNEAKTQYNTTMNALQQDSGAGTLAAIFSFMKTLDPRSVVREGEFQMGTQTGGVVDTLVGMVNRAQGQGMGPEARRGIAETIQAIMEGRLADAEEISARYDLIAQEQGVPTSQIRTGEYNPDLQGVPESFNVKEGANLPTGTKNMGNGVFRLPDGTLVRKK